MKRILTMEHALLLCLSKRGKLTTEQKRQLERDELGHGGEIGFDSLIEKHGSTTWYHFKNIWIDYFGYAQIDSLIITESGIFLADIKNYGNHYAYQNLTWTYQGRPLSKNINQQLADNIVKCQSLSKVIPAMKNTQGVIIFINERAVPTIIDPMPVNYLLRYQLYDWLDSLKQPVSGNKISIHKTAEQIKPFIIPNPYDHNYFCSDEEFKQLRKGIYCCNCGSFHLEIRKYTVKCACGHRENKERAVLRSICEYGVLQNHKNLSAYEIFNFLNEQVPIQYIYRKLNIFFTPIPDGKRIFYYENPKMLFDFVFDETSNNSIQRIF